MSAEAAFQAGVLTRLAADPQVQGVFGHPARLYDRAPRGAAFPFLSLGRGESEPADGDGVTLIDHRLTLHVWARREDFAGLKTALQTLRASLHGAGLPLDAGWRCVSCRVVYTDSFTGADGRTVHGLVRVRAMLENAPAT